MTHIVLRTFALTLTVSLAMPALAEESSEDPSYEVSTSSPRVAKEDEFAFGLHAGASWPQIVTMGPSLKVGDLAATLNAGFFPKNPSGYGITTFSAALSYQTSTYTFMSLAGGYQEMQSWWSDTVSISDPRPDRETKVTSYFVTPALGYNSRRFGNWTHSIEAGVQVPFGSKERTTLKAPTKKSNQLNMDSAGLIDAIGNKPHPYILISRFTRWF